MGREYEDYWSRKLITLVSPDELDEIIGENEYDGFEDFNPGSHCGNAMLDIYYKVWSLLNVVFEESKNEILNNRKYVTQTVEYMYLEWNIICYG